MGIDDDNRSPTVPWGGNENRMGGRGLHMTVLAGPCAASAYAPTSKKSTLASDSADNMSLKSGLNNVRFLECPSGKC